MSAAIIEPALGPGLVVTVPPYSDFAQQVAGHPLVRAIRLNTAMPFRQSPEELLSRFRAFPKPVIVDLKGRQLRVIGGALPPFTVVQVSHPVRVPVPCLASFGSGRELVRVLAVEGDRLFLEDGPRRYIGPGESVNLLHPRLQVEGYLTEQDRDYLRAMNRFGMVHAMLSFFERPDDLAEVQRIVPGVVPVLKIESARGLDQLPWIAEHNLLPMIARGDLLVELGCPVSALQATERAVKRVPRAWIGSRFLSSLSRQPQPTLADVMDVAHCLRLGYRTLMLGDEVCQRGDTVAAALDYMQNIFQADEGGTGLVSRADFGATV